jgi:hypothetical protein
MGNGVGWRSYETKCNGCLDGFTQGRKRRADGARRGAEKYGVFVWLALRVGRGDESGGVDRGGARGVFRDGVFGDAGGSGDHSGAARSDGGSESGERAVEELDGDEIASRAGRDYSGDRSGEVRRAFEEGEGELPDFAVVERGDHAVGEAGLRLCARRRRCGRRAAGFRMRPQIATGSATDRDVIDSGRFCVH